MSKTKIFKRMRNYWIVTLILLLFGIFLGCSPTTEENPSRSNFPTISVYKNDVYLAWQHTKKLKFQIYFKRGRKQGRDWDKEAKISRAGESCIYPDTEANRNNVYLVWNQNNRDGSTGVMFAKSKSGGATWSKPKQITSPGGICQEPKITVEGKNLYVIYEDEREGVCQPYFLKSNDEGKNWSKEINLCERKQQSNEPDIVVQKDQVFAVWHEKVEGNYEIFFRKSRDGGKSWDKSKRLTFTEVDSYYPSIAVDKGLVHVVWHDLRNGDAEIYYKRSKDEGENWEDDVRLTKAKYQSFNPDIVAEKGKVFVSWEDLRSGQYQIYLKKSDNSGNSWSKDQRLTHMQYGAGYIEMAKWKDNIYIVWTDTRSGADQIYFMSSNDLGKSWNREERITR